MTTTTTAPTTTLILTPEQHAEIRACLEALMEYAALQRDASQDATEAGREQAHSAAMDAANALDLLDAAAADMAAMVWAASADERGVKH